MTKLNEIFKETMDALHVKASELAIRSGRSRNNISDIRVGKVSPAIGDFWGLVEHCEQISPGFKAEFAKRLNPAPALESQLSDRELAYLLRSLLDKNLLSVALAHLDVTQIGRIVAESGSELQRRSTSSGKGLTREAALV